ncbi:MAG: hybrid sensor histidine kinase/response regulator [Leptolyngbyaceae cyanobacterium CRU_2_3]|nr:hybrid sensor histidine kinase/response regulator [Leptolyngbyaceae cyanobacterium CRU_2_3]
MLQLPAFIQLCESVSQYIRSVPEDGIQEIAQLALQAWRRSQALVLVGQMDAMPVAIESASFAPHLVEYKPELEQPDLLEASSAFWTEVETDGSELTESWFDLTESLPSEGLPSEAMEDWASAAAQVLEPAYPAVESVSSAFVSSEFVSSVESAPPIETEPANSEAFTVQSMIQPITASEKVAVTASDKVANVGRVREFRVPEMELDTNTRDAPENSVRVPVKQLEQLSDLFGELTIERNGLDLHLKRVRDLVQTLSQRVQILERSNAQLRNSYDKVSSQSDFNLPALDLGLETASPQNLLSGSEASQNSIAHPSAANDSTSLAHLKGFDSLEMDRYNDLHLMSQEVMETIVQIQEVSIDIELGLEDTEQTARELNKTSRQLRTKLTQVRMRPLSDITDRFPRAIRELSLQHNKPVQIQISGANTLVDRNILEAISDPLMHLLRNAFDHGIEDAQTRKERSKPEQGLIEIRALHRNNRTVLTVSDDGGGIPLEKVRAKARQMGLDEVLLAAASDEELLSLIFEPGFSTSDQVTSLSGRGVGMDVVRDRLRQVQGEIKVDTQPGVGTTFTLSVPFTLSVARVLIVESHGMLMAFPIDAIEEMLLLPPEQVIATAGNEAFTWENTMVQLIRLSQWLEFRRAYQPEGLETQASISVPTVLLLAQGNHFVGLQVERSWGEQEVAIRKVEGGLPMPPGFSNCTILGDGRVVPMVNAPELLHWIASCERSKADTPSRQAPNILSSIPPLKPETFYGTDRPPTILVIDDSINVRRLLALTLEKAGYQVAQAKDGQDALDKLTAGLQVQAVICDIEMPRLDGYGFLAKIKASAALEHIPVTMLTSRSGDKHRQLAMSLGASAYFSKPYNEQALLQTLETLVGLEAVV